MNLKDFWNTYHSLGKLDSYSNTQTSFAKEVENLIPPQSKLLDLGCGLGNDSYFFATKGHTVVATDISEVAVAKNNNRYKRTENLSFHIMDTSKSFPYNSGVFDIVYARLSLHYFTDEITKQVFKEIYRVLKPNGYLCFTCRSVNDSKYGKGTLLMKDIYENSKGHVRHFFTKEYAQECLNDMYNIRILEEINEKLYDEQSAYIKCIANKI